MKKFWLKSVTMKGLLIALLGSALGYVGLETPRISPVLDFAVQYADEIFKFGGLLIAAYGRWQAVAPLTSRKK